MRLPAHSRIGSSKLWLACNRIALRLFVCFNATWTRRDDNSRKAYFYGDILLGSRLILDQAETLLFGYI